MRQGAGAAILDARAVRPLDERRVAPAALAQAVERAEAEQTVQLVGRHVMARVELACRVIEKLIVMRLHRAPPAHVPPCNSTSGTAPATPTRGIVSSKAAHVCTRHEAAPTAGVADARE